MKHSTRAERLDTDCALTIYDVVAKQATLTLSELVMMPVPKKSAAAASRMPSYEAAVAAHRICPNEAARRVQLRPLLLVYRYSSSVPAKNRLPSPEMERELQYSEHTTHASMYEALIDPVQVRAASWLVNTRLMV